VKKIDVRRSNFKQNTSILFDSLCLSSMRVMYIIETRHY